MIVILSWVLLANYRTPILGVNAAGPMSLESNERGAVSVVGSGPGRSSREPQRAAIRGRRRASAASVAPGPGPRFFMLCHM